MQQQQQQQQQRSSPQGQGLVSGTATSLLFQGGENNASMLTSGVSGQGAEVGVGAMDDCPLDLLALRAERRVMRVSQGQRQGQAPGQGLGLGLGGQGVSMTPPLGSFDEQGNNIISGQCSFFVF